MRTYFEVDKKGVALMEKLNNQLKNASDEVLEVIKSIIDVKKIKDDETDEILKRLESRVFLLRELVDFRMGRGE